MSVPRITLWTDPFIMPVRLAGQQTFRQAGIKREPFTGQAQAIQTNSETITITPGAIYILSAIAGRRLVEPIRWVLLDSLRDILNGELRTEHAEHQDLLDATFGEMLGSLALALQLDGNVEIVRLIESNLGKTPDFIVLQEKDGHRIAHLLECKGTVKDINNINAAGSWDLCNDLRKFRKPAEEQLDNLLLHPANFQHLKTSFTVSMNQGSRGRKKVRSGLSEKVVSRNVAVVCVPDGRILRRSKLKTTDYPSRSCCRGSQITCVDCITSKLNVRQSNVVVVLYQEEIAQNLEIDSNFSAFLRIYRRAQRAIWTDDDNEFRDSLNQLLEHLNNPQNDLELKSTESFVVASLVEAGSEQELDLSDIPAEEISNAARRFLQMSIDDVVSEARREKTIRRRENINVDALQDDIPVRIVNRTLRPEAKLLLRDGQSYTEPGFRPAISGSIQWSGGDAVIRLSVNPSSSEGQRRLQLYIDDLIRRLRGPANVVTIEWRDEYAQLAHRKVVMGYSWDLYPYAHIRKHCPGITAWRSNEGRAEIIVRPPKPF